jgi:hypothetical protein
MEELIRTLLVGFLYVVYILLIPFVILAFIEDLQVIQRILERLGLWLVKKNPRPRPMALRWNFIRIIPAGFRLRFQPVRLTGRRAELTAWPPAQRGLRPGGRGRRQIRRSHLLRTISTEILSIPLWLGRTDFQTRLGH